MLIFGFFRCSNFISFYSGPTLATLNDALICGMVKVNVFTEESADSAFFGVSGEVAVKPQVGEYAQKVCILMHLVT